MPSLRNHEIINGEYRSNDELNLAVSFARSTGQGQGSQRFAEEEAAKSQRTGKNRGACAPQKRIEIPSDVRHVR